MVSVVQEQFGGCIMPLSAMRLTRRDLRYYYFYCFIGENMKRARREEQLIFYHVFDHMALERAEAILKRLTEKYRFQEGKFAEKVLYAVLRRFHPTAERSGAIVKEWTEADLRTMASRRRSRVRWYFVTATVEIAKGNMSFKRARREHRLREVEFRSKSFPALSGEEAVAKGRHWLARLEKRLKRNEYLYMASIFYANHDRIPGFDIPGTETSTLYFYDRPATE